MKTLSEIYMYVIQSLHFFTYVHERAFHLYTRAILALKFEADKECSTSDIKDHVKLYKRCFCKNPLRNAFPRRFYRVDSTCRIHNILSKIIWSIRFLVVHTILNRWILPSSTFAFNELRNFLRNKI